MNTPLYKLADEYLTIAQLLARSRTARGSHRRYAGRCLRRLGGESMERGGANPAKRGRSSHD